MKKTWTALAALTAISGAALAQNTVTVYGIIDVGLVHTTGLASQKNQLVSGVMEGSRFGLRGNEDLGGGYRALFTMEHRAEVNNGTTSNRPPSGLQVPDRLSQASLMGLPGALQPAVSAIAGNLAQSAIGVNLPNRFWDRQIYIGLVTPFGAVLAGRQYTPAYEVTATFDALGTQSALSAGQVASLPASTDIRVSNALQYRIVLGGLTASAMYSLGDPAVVPGNSKAARLGGVMAMYRAGGFAVGVGHNQRNNDIGQKSLTSTVVGASAGVGPGTIYGMYATVEDKNPSGVSGIAAALTPSTGPAGAFLVQNAFTNALRMDGSLMHLGYKMPVGGAHTLYVAYSRFDDKRAPDADTASFGAAFTYALSKRTDINAVYARFNNKNLAQAAPGNAGYLGGVTKSAGADANSLSLGVRHRF
jgi:predicted porin